MDDTFDILILGGGPAGASAGVLLARAGLSVAIVEKSTFPRPKVCGEFLSATNLPLLQHLGLADTFLAAAGPEVRRVGLFAGDTILHADLPSVASRAPFGRALRRQNLDTLLLDTAAHAGAKLYQPFAATELHRDGHQHVCIARHRESKQQITLSAPIVIAAHGSWDAGTLPTQLPRTSPKPSDLFAFKVHFIHTNLPPDLMPLIVFPGGYGGMVTADAGRASLSCCIRRDQLAHLRREFPGASAADAVLAHIQRSCLGARDALCSATSDGTFLSAGPIRPGIRLRCDDGIFPIGNLAGESHPIIAEGISMAVQSAWLLCEILIEHRADLLGQYPENARRRAAVAYGSAWRRAFAPRLFAASFFAHWALSPLAVRTTLPLLRCAPALLRLGARLSGKVDLLPTLAVSRD